jgi:hypothetical protein
MNWTSFAPWRATSNRRIGAINEGTTMKVLIRNYVAVGLFLALLGAVPSLADGFTNCTKEPKASWKPASEAEAAAKAAGYDVRRSKIEGSCYEVYALKDGKLFELFYSPADLKLIHTKAK